ncbi:MAG: LuxR C-terminal-related transcriptional regulator, partial [Eubacteriales bacterium]|nr:LuxR C-terminal-related transcriptional regulator [Eubacteriales bacterium]
VDEIVEDKLLLDMLSKALSELTDEERFLIDELFYQEKPERMVAKETGVSQNTVNYHKNRILEKLRRLLEKKF